MGKGERRRIHHLRNTGRKGIAPILLAVTLGPINEQEKHERTGPGLCNRTSLKGTRKARLKSGTFVLEPAHRRITPETRFIYDPSKLRLDFPPPCLRAERNRVHCRTPIAVIARLPWSCRDPANLISRLITNLIFDDLSIPTLIPRGPSHDIFSCGISEV